MKFIKWMWGDITLAQKIALMGVLGTLGICAYGATQHPVWWLPLVCNVVVLWYIIYAEWRLYKIKKWMDSLGGKYDI